ncbi:hypothetical protein CVU37_01325 [candidate division BRC1 bacterium HGW-BRC1-1]|jgi:hypothetical protein|nr:MAG: hypothetical protein CVU37_01325 [candidate division BRC1 bacterium HGW-BRC1-1]
MSTPPPDDYAIAPFVCLGCGNCCRGDGFVRVNSTEISRLAQFLSLTDDEFRATYTRVPEDLAQAAAGDRWLTERPGPERDCIFLENNRCLVNPVKPDQCVGFPTQWRTPDIMDYCEGMRRA